MCTSISKGPTLSILQPTRKLRLQFSEQRCYVGCILIPCVDKVGSFEMDVHKYQGLGRPLGDFFVMQVVYRPEKRENIINSSGGSIKA